MQSSLGRLTFVVTEDWYFWSHRLTLARRALAAGYEVSVVTREGEHGDRIREAGIHLEPWSVARGNVGIVREFKALVSLYRALRRTRPDIVHNVALKPVVFGTLAAWAVGCRRVVNALAGLGYVFSSQTPAAKRLRAPLRLALRTVLGDGRGRIIVQNPDDRDWLAGIGITASRIALIRGSGVDLDRFRPVSEPQTGPIIVTMVSRMLRDKGVTAMVEAARLLRECGSDIVVRLVGPPDPGNPASMREIELRELANAGIVEWQGPREDIETVWSECHIAALPSAYAEGLPKSLLEAAACGKPIIATDVPGCREIAREGKTALLVPPGDPQALANAMVRLSEDARLRVQYGANGRRLVETDFADDVIVRAVLAVYEDLQQ